MIAARGPRRWDVAAAAACACLAFTALAAPAIAQTDPNAPTTTQAVPAEPSATPAPPVIAPTDIDPTAADFETRWIQTAGAFAARATGDEETRQRRPQKDQPGLVILQLGDSHTAADFFTGELRKRLQALFGNGGAGYMTAGKPHPGVRSSAFRMTASSGWTYKSLFKATDPSEFWLSGYNATATETGQTLTLDSEQAVPFDSIEIETVRQPGGGAIEIKLDGKVESRYDLKADTAEPVVIRLDPQRTSGDKVKQIRCHDDRAGTVNIASVAVYHRQSGLAYNAVGFPGAQINLLDKFDERVLASELHRLSPQIVVLAFGTNEAFRDDLDAAAYTQVYERTVTRIQSILPGLGDRRRLAARRPPARA